MKIRQITFLSVCLLAWNVLFTGFWVGYSETLVAARAANLMRRDIVVANETSLEHHYGPLIALVGVNVMLAICLLLTVFEKRRTAAELITDKTPPGN